MNRFATPPRLPKNTRAVPLPEHLERREIIIEPAELTKSCKKIGEEITEEMEYEPGKLFVNRYVRPKYAKSGNGGIIIAPMIDARYHLKQRHASLSQ